MQIFCFFEKKYLAQQPLHHVVDVPPLLALARQTLGGGVLRVHGREVRVLLHAGRLAPENAQQPAGQCAVSIGDREEECRDARDFLERVVAGRDELAQAGADCEQADPFRKLTQELQALGQNGRFIAARQEIAKNHGIGVVVAAHRDEQVEGVQLGLDHGLIVGF